MSLAVVTGATGCVGRNLVDVLLAKNWDVVVLHRKSSDLSRLAGCKVRFQEVDLHDAASTLAAVPEGADVVFHAAANTSHWHIGEDIQWRDNVLATRHLVDAALAKRVSRFIFTSSGSTRFYQETNAEEAARIPVPYVRTKRLSELEVYRGLAQGLDAVVLHPIIIVGQHDYNSYSQIFSYLQAGHRLSFPGHITFCHAQDVALGHLAAALNGRRGERYVLGGPYRKWQEFFSLAAKALGQKQSILEGPRWLLTVGAHSQALVSNFTRKMPMLTPYLMNLVKHEPEITTYDIYKAKTDLDYGSRSLEEMVQTSVAWYLATLTQDSGS